MECIVRLAMSRNTPSRYRAGAFLSGVPDRDASAQHLPTRNQPIKPVTAVLTGPEGHHITPQHTTAELYFSSPSHAVLCADSIHVHGYVIRKTCAVCLRLEYQYVRRESPNNASQSKDIHLARLKQSVPTLLSSIQDAHATYLLHAPQGFNQDFLHTSRPTSESSYSNAKGHFGSVT